MFAVFLLFICVYVICAEKPFAHAGRVGVVIALACVERADRVHLVPGKLKVENLHIALDSLGLYRFREDDYTLLILKTEDDLPRVFALFFGNFRDYGICMKRCVALTERSPRFKLYIVFIK